MEIYDHRNLAEGGRITIGHHVAHRSLAGMLKKKESRLSLLGTTASWPATQPVPSVIWEELKNIVLVNQGQNDPTENNESNQGESMNVNEIGQNSTGFRLVCLGLSSFGFMAFHGLAIYYMTAPIVVMGAGLVLCVRSLAWFKGSDVDLASPKAAPESDS